MMINKDCINIQDGDQMNSVPVGEVDLNKINQMIDDEPMITEEDQNENSFIIRFRG
jgi:hypothetical protein